VVVVVMVVGGEPDQPVIGLGSVGDV